MLRSRVATRLTMALMATGTLVACIAVISFVRRGERSVAAAVRPAPRFKIAWQSNVGPLTWLSYSPNGEFFCAVMAKGDVSVYSSSGARHYTVRLPDVTSAVVTDDGRLLMAYSARDPSGSTLTFLDSAGRVYWTVKASGAIWAADVHGDAGRATFVAGTGEKYVYVIELGRHRKHYRRWRAAGAVTSAAIDPGGQEVTFATWQRSTIARATLRGRRLWEIEAQPASIQRIEALDSTDRILVCGAPNKPGVDGEFALLDQAGNTVTRGTISACENTRVLAAPNGRYVCLAQDRLIEHKGKSMREKHAVLLDSGGRTVIDKGSLFFQADPLLVTRDGAVLLAGAKNAVFGMSASGDLEVMAKVPARITRCVASRDRTRALIECSGGKLIMLAAPGR